MTEQPATPEAMNPRLANALLTEGPMTPVELETVRAFYHELARMMVAAGPLFAPSHRTAMQLHDQAAARINGKAPDPVRRREREREEEARRPVEP